MAGEGAGSQGTKIRRAGGRPVGVARLEQALRRGPHCESDLPLP